MNILEELKSRNLVKEVTNEEKFLKAVEMHKGVYVGFDPTAKSLHLGNYVMMAFLKRLKIAGLKPFAVLGGATGMIGDPSGKTNDRQLLNLETIELNKKHISQQLKNLIGCRVVDNYDFYKDMSVIDFLRIIGKRMNVNHMLSKEMVKSRLESGISYTEFSYQILQSWDFKNLYEKENVWIQAGGSDQWGNIISGIELIDKFKKDDEIAQASGITLNLLTNSAGKKFGKSVKGAIFLDTSLTSVYEMYQFLLNQTDKDVEKLLKALSFISLDEIKTIMTKHAEAPFKKEAQKILAEAVVSDIHSKEDLEEAKLISKALFSGDITNIDPIKLFASLKNSIPNSIELEDKNIVDLLVDSKIVPSKREARQLIDNKAIALNGRKITNYDDKLVINDSLNKKFSLLKKGKRNWFLLKHYSE